MPLFANVPRVILGAALFLMGHMVMAAALPDKLTVLAQDQGEGGVFSADGTRVAYVKSWRDGKQSVAVNGKSGKKYDQVSGLSLLANGEPVYLGKNGERSIFVRNDQELIIEGNADDFFLSPNRQSVAVTVKPGPHRTLIVVDGHAHPEVENLRGPLLFSPDSRKTAYVANCAKGVCLVVDGSQVRSYPTSIVVHKGSSMSVADNPEAPKQISFTAQGELRTDIPHGANVDVTSGRFYVVNDRYPGDAIRMENAMLGWKPMASSRYGEHVPHAGELQVDSRPVARHEWIEQVKFLPDGTPTFVARSTRRYQASLWNRVLDRLSGATPDGDFYEDARSQNLPESTRLQVRHTLFLGARALGPYSWILDYAVSADSRHVALVVADEPWRHVASPTQRYVVVDGKRHASYDDISCLSIDAQGRVAYVATRGGQFVVVDGVAGRPYSRVECPRLSFDGRQIEYGAMFDDKYVWIREQVSTLAPVSPKILAGTYLGMLNSLPSSGNPTLERFGQQQENDEKLRYRALHLDSDSQFRFEIRERQTHAILAQVLGRFTIDGFYVRLSPYSRNTAATADLVRRHLSAPFVWQEDLAVLQTTVTLPLPGGAPNETTWLSDRYVKYNTQPEFEAN